MGVGIHLCTLASIWSADWGERYCLYARHILHLHIDADESLIVGIMPTDVETCPSLLSPPGKICT